MATVTMAAAACATAAAAAAVLALASSSPSCDDERNNNGATVTVEEEESPPPATSQECVVCLSGLITAGDGVGSSDADAAGAAETPAVRTLPGCGHGFHAECISRWLAVRPECPLCRAPVPLEQADHDAIARGQPDVVAWARPASRIACGFGDGRVVWTRSPSVQR